MTQRKLLVVEDIPETIDGVLEDVIDRGVLVEYVGNIQEAIELLQARVYDGVLVDWRVPLRPHEMVDDDAGAELLRYFAAADKTQMNFDVPVLVVTAQRNAVDHRQVKETRNCRAVVDKMQLDQFDEELFKMFP